MAPPSNGNWSPRRLRLPVFLAVLSGLLGWLAGTTAPWYVKLPVALVCAATVGLFSLGYAQEDDNTESR